MILLKCCCVPRLALVDSACPEHLSGRFAKFIPSPVWSLLVEYIFYVGVVVESASRRPFPATQLHCFSIPLVAFATPSTSPHHPPQVLSLSLFAPSNVPGSCSPDEHPAAYNITRKSSQLHIPAAMSNVPTLATLGVSLSFCRDARDAVGTL